MTEKIIEKAEVLFLQKRYVDAEKLLNELLSHDPNDVGALMMLAQVCLALDKIDKALKLIDSAISLDPDYDPLFFVKAKVLIQKEKLVEAEASIKHALKSNPLDADYYSLLASIK